MLRRTLHPGRFRGRSGVVALTDAPSFTLTLTVKALALGLPKSAGRRLDAQAFGEPGGAPAVRRLTPRSIELIAIGGALGGSWEGGVAHDRRGTQLPTVQTYPGGAWAAAGTMALITAVVGIVGFLSFSGRDG
jgi:hypothetical protein